jgi:hypothetical protein
MRRLLLGSGVLLTVLSLGVTGTANAGEKGEKKGEPGWVQLFNGKDLKGWKTHPKSPGMWRVEEGAIVSGGKDVSHLFSERDDYENFHYRIEAKINDKGNSGQYFRAKFAPGYPPGYEAQINSNFPPDPQRTGSLYNLAKVTEMLVPPDTWFTQEVIANGNHIQIILNGKKVVDYQDPKNRFTRGHFALQQHGAYRDKSGKVYETVLHVRKIEVKKLPPTKGEKEAPEKRGSVSGTIRYQGKPLPGGTVTFFHSESSKAFSGAILADGTYSRVGVPVGKVQITIDNRPLREFGLKGPETDKAGKFKAKIGTPPDRAGLRYVPLPAAYQEVRTSGLTFEVQPGRQEFNLELR